MIPIILLSVCLVSFATIVIYLYIKGTNNLKNPQFSQTLSRNVLAKQIENKIAQRQYSYKDEYGRNLLIQSICYNFPHLALVLIEKEIDLNDKDENGDTALMFASKFGLTEVVKHLLVHGANPNIISRSGISPLWLAAGYGFLGIVDLLVKFGADPNFRDHNWGMTPIMRAAKGAKFKTVYYLLNLNPDLTVRAQNGQTLVELIEMTLNKTGGMPNDMLSVIDKIFLRLNEPHKSLEHV